MIENTRGGVVGEWDMGVSIRKMVWVDLLVDGFIIS